MHSNMIIDILLANLHITTRAGCIMTLLLVLFLMTGNVVIIMQTWVDSTLKRVFRASSRCTSNSKDIQTMRAHWPLWLSLSMSLYV